MPRDRAGGRCERAGGAGVATDLRYAAPLSPTVDVSAGDYDALTDAALVLITAGVNELAGGATDRSDQALVVGEHGASEVFLWSRRPWATPQSWICSDETSN